jgi:hypothetical protein
MFFVRSLFLLCNLAWFVPTAIAQVVQMPRSETFSLSASTTIPDTGSAYLGSSAYSRSGSTGRGSIGGVGSYGSNLGRGGVSVQSTVIDLAELDSMIRSQSGKIPGQAKLQPKDPEETGRKRAAASGRIDQPDYDYLIALSSNQDLSQRGDPDAVAYYLGMAEQARSRGTWSSVELYYSLAWKNLPAARREAALLELARARAQGKKNEGLLKITEPSK